MKVTRSENRLYKLLAETEKSECLLAKSDEVSNLWHIRLGHVNQLSMALMQQRNMVYGLPNFSHSKEVCKGVWFQNILERRFLTRQLTGQPRFCN